MVIRALVVLGLLITTLTATLAPDDSDAKKKKKHHKTVTRRFDADWPFATTYVPIPDHGNAGIYPFEFTVQGLRKGKIRDVNLTIAFCHEFADDLDLLLVAPNGRNALIMSDAGGPNSAWARLTLDDEAAAPLPDSGPLGDCASSVHLLTYRPANYTPISDSDDFPGAPSPSGAVALNTFDGGNPNGAWRLYIRDDFSGSPGYLYPGLRLEITARVKKK